MLWRSILFPLRVAQVSVDILDILVGDLVRVLGLYFHLVAEQVLQQDAAEWFPSWTHAGDPL